uniref:Uncharacterized protein n=1 Tax=Eutreptiella gymnastica TaxID=73025 RepID=A0A7S4GD87_9EUGL
MNTLQVPTGPTQGPSNGLAAVLIYPYTLLVSEAQGATTVVLFNKDDGSIRTSPSPWGRRGSAYSHTAAQRSSTSSSTGAWHRNPELFRSVSREGLWVLRVHAPAPAVFQVEVFDGANAVTTIPCVPPELYQDFVPDKLHPATPEELRALSAPAALGMPTAAVVMPRSVSPMEVRSVSPMMNDRSTSPLPQMPAMPQVACAQTRPYPEISMQRLAPMQPMQPMAPMAPLAPMSQMQYMAPMQPPVYPRAGGYALQYQAQAVPQRYVRL